MSRKVNTSICNPGGCLEEKTNNWSGNECIFALFKWKEVHEISPPEHKLLEVYADYGCDWSHSNKRTGRDEVLVNAEILFPFG